MSKLIFQCAKTNRSLSAISFSLWCTPPTPVFFFFFFFFFFWGGGGVLNSKFHAPSHHMYTIQPGLCRTSGLEPPKTSSYRAHDAALMVILRE